MMTQHQNDSNNNGIKPWIKWEFFWLIVQFMVLLSAMIYSYANFQNKLSSLDSSLNQHLAVHSQFLRVDVWETRNRFIDEKLSRIEGKLDAILTQQKMDNDRQRGRQ